MEGVNGAVKTYTLNLLSDSRQKGIAKKKSRSEIPVWQKRLLTLEEAAEYTGLGLQKLRDISNDENCDFVLWNGTKRMFKRKKLETYLESVYSI